MLYGSMRELVKRLVDYYDGQYISMARLGTVDGSE